MSSTASNHESILSDALTILNVDDNTTNRYVVTRTLRNAGFRVVEAGSGREALESAADRPTLILLDVNLPDINGFEVCRILKADPLLCTIPVVHLTASFASSENKVIGLEGGADGYLVRPVEPPELIATIHSILRSREAERVARRMSEEWQATFDAIGDAACMVDAEGVVLRCNRAMADLLKSNLDQILGRSLNDKLTSALAPPNASPIFYVPQVAVPIRCEARVANRWYRVAADPILDESGQQSGSVYILEDITPAKRAADEIASHQAHIEELNDRLRQGMRETHHRVKNNLQIIAAMVDLQVLEGNEAIATSELQRLAMHIKALAAVHDLLTASAKDDSAVEWVSAKTVLEKLLPLLRDMAGTSTIRDEIEDARLTIRQATSLAIITNEVVNNAIKHGKGNIEMRFAADDSIATLIICDNGPGFPEGFTSTRDANTGIELVDNLSKWDLGGSVEYANRLEGGACVTVSMPVANPRQIDDRSAHRD
jgi:PAS domain S-box-containing protein